MQNDKILSITEIIYELSSACVKSVRLVRDYKRKLKLATPFFG
jgi:hypothetical protein